MFRSLAFAALLAALVFSGCCFSHHRQHGPCATKAPCELRDSPCDKAPCKTVSPCGKPCCAVQPAATDEVKK